MATSAKNNDKSVCSSKAETEIYLLGAARAAFHGNRAGRFGPIGGQLARRADCRILGVMCGEGKLRLQSFSGLFLFMLALSVPASASSEIRVDKKGLVKATSEHIVEVLASSDICDEGCRYYGPNIAREVKLSYRATDASFYKWTHVSGVKSVKFFKHYQVTRGPVTRVTIRVLTEDQDKALIAELREKTGWEHAPLFEASKGEYTITKKGSEVEVDIRTTTRIGGILSLLSGTVRKETEKSLDALFLNFSR